MNMTRPRRLVAAALALAAAGAQAQEDYVAIRCEPAQGIVRIEKHVDMPSSAIPRDPGVRALQDMVGSRPKEGAPDDGWLFPQRDLLRACVLGRARYVVRARAKIWGARAMGRCGAAPISVEVGVTRNGVILLKDFVMGDDCGSTGTSDMGIASVELSERVKTLTVYASMLGDEPPDRRYFDLRKPFAALPSLTLQQVYAERPAAPASAASAP